jgi:hypothetical protein
VRRRLVVAAAGVAALALSIPIALLGRAVLATPTTPQTDVRWPSSARVSRAPTLPERAATALLGDDRPEDLLAIARAYRHAAALPAFATGSLTPVRLGQMTESLDSAQERAQAHVYVGAILGLPAGSGGMSFDALRRLGAGRLLDQAAAEFRTAASLDDRDEAAKYDLELLLKSEAPSRTSRRAKSGHSSSTKKQTAKRRLRKRRRSKSSRTRRRERTAGIYGTGSGY